MADPKIYVFSDLDDTLIQSKGKLPQGVAFETGAYNCDGLPRSFFSSHQRALLSLVERSGAVIIPVTGRSCEALGRVDYAFSSFRAVSHGAVVVKPDGKVCSHWLKSVNVQTKDWPGILGSINEQIHKRINNQNLDARTRVVVDQGITAYVSVKGTLSALAALEPSVRESSLGFHRNGRGLALLPPYASKKRAVEHIKQFLDIEADDLILGMGDSVTDLPFIRSCHFGVIPVNSQIDRELTCESL